LRILFNFTAVQLNCFDLAMHITQCYAYVQTMSIRCIIYFRNFSVVNYKLFMP